MEALPGEGNAGPRQPEAREEPRGVVAPEGEPGPNGTILVKIGGSILGSHDTTLQDLVAMQQAGTPQVVVHGGGKVITEWMVRQGVRPRFVRGLRVTDAASLEIVVAVLTGLINKSIVASINALGGRAVGLSGVDGGMLRAGILDPELGLVGRVEQVDTGAIDALVEAGFIPVIAPVALLVKTESITDGSLVNVNADTVAGEIAAAIGAERLVMLTDVEGVMDSSRRLIPKITRRQAIDLMSSNVIAGGMVPKIGACLKALERVRVSHIVDGRKANALRDTLEGKALGTRLD
jgi:acetylglutamate kinase